MAPENITNQQVGQFFLAMFLMLCILCTATMCVVFFALDYALAGLGCSIAAVAGTVLLARMFLRLVRR